MRLNGTVAALGAAALAWVLPQGHAAAQGAPPAVKLGIVTFLSGPPAGPFGIPARNAAELLVEAINAGTLPAPYDAKGFGGARLDPSSSTRTAARPRWCRATATWSSGAAPTLVRRLYLLGKLPRRRAGGGGAEDAHRVLRLRHAAHLRGCRPTITSSARPRPRPSTAPGRPATSARKVADVKSFSGINQNYAWGQDSWSDFEGAIKDLKPGLKEATSQFPKLFAGQYSTEITTLLPSSAGRRAFELLGRRSRELHPAGRIRAACSRRSTSYISTARDDDVPPRPQDRRRHHHGRARPVGRLCPRHRAQSLVPARPIPTATARRRSIPRTRWRSRCSA